MYCKKCGKKISDKTRFCDRCGHPSKSKSTGKNSQNSRKHPPKHSSSKRKPDSYDIYRKNKMKREAEKRHREKRRKRISMWLIFFAMILSVGAGFYAYYSTMQNINNGESGLTDEVKVPSDTGENAGTVTDNDLNEESEPSEKYFMHKDDVYGFECPYPSSFEIGTTSNENIRLSLLDPEGDAEMLISRKEIASTQTANNLMRDYVKGIGVDEFDSLAGDNYYEVTFTRTAKINHRKAVIVNEGEVIYYDFVYGSVSEHADEYEEYIEYIDAHFDNMAAGIEGSVDDIDEEVEE